LPKNIVTFPLYNARRLSVCLSVCLQLYVKLVKGSSRQFITTDVSVDSEKLIKFRKSSACGSESRIFRRNFQYCEIPHFSAIWFISPKRV